MCIKYSIFVCECMLYIFSGALYLKNASWRVKGRDKTAPWQTRHSKNKEILCRLIFNESCLKVLDNTEQICFVLCLIKQKLWFNCLL